ncbi:MAG: hypothetical protein JWP75_3378, partial [Frondihabitans sp.]|nr:hypothetical protein [Frondihabitans sp.]
MLAGFRAIARRDCHIGETTRGGAAPGRRGAAAARR